MLRTSQLPDRRMMPTNNPSNVAATMLMAETSRVLSTQTSSARAYVSPTAHGISRNGMSKFALSARKPKPKLVCRCARLPAASLARNQTAATTTASSNHCAARPRGDARRTMSVPGRRVHQSALRVQIVHAARKAQAAFVAKRRVIDFAVIADVFEDPIGPVVIDTEQLAEITLQAEEAACLRILGG